MYAASIHHINKITIDDEKEKVLFDTDLRNYDRPFEAVKEFIKYWALVENDGQKTAVQIQQKQETHQMDVYIESNNDETRALIDILKGNITKIQEDPNFIKQANAITGNVNAIINLKKTQLEIFKTARAINKGK